MALRNTRLWRGAVTLATAGLLMLGVAGTSIATGSTEAHADTTCSGASFPLPGQAPSDANPAWLQALNAIRTQFGVPSVKENPVLDSAALAHSQYEAVNGMTHNENPNASGYTPQGCLAGQSAVLAGASDPVSAMHMWLAAPYHAAALLYPATRSVGLGMANGQVTLVVYGDVDPSLIGSQAQGMYGSGLAFPANGSTTSLRYFNQFESPNPVTDYCGGQSPASTGLPLIAAFGPGHPIIASPTVTLTGVPTGASGPVDSPAVCAFGSGTTGNSILLQNQGAVVGMPATPLRPGYTYQVTVDATDAQSSAALHEAWSFSTEARTPSVQLTYADASKYGLQAAVYAAVCDQGVDADPAQMAAPARAPHGTLQIQTRTPGGTWQNAPVASGVQPGVSLAFHAQTLCGNFYPQAPAPTQPQVQSGQVAPQAWALVPVSASLDVRAVFTGTDGWGSGVSDTSTVTSPGAPVSIMPPTVSPDITAGLKAGSSITVTGILSGWPNGTVSTGQVQLSIAGQSSPFATATVNADGSYSLTGVPPTSGQLIVSYTGNSSWAPATYQAGQVALYAVQSTTLTVTSKSPTATAVTAGTTLTVNGTLTGQGSVPVGATVQMHLTSGTGYVYQLGSATVSATGTFTVTGKIGTTGTVTLAYDATTGSTSTIQYSASTATVGQYTIAPAVQSTTLTVTSKSPSATTVRAGTALTVNGTLKGQGSVPVGAKVQLRLTTATTGAVVQLGTANVSSTGAFTVTGRINETGTVALIYDATTGSTSTVKYTASTATVARYAVNATLAGWATTGHTTRNTTVTFNVTVNPGDSNRYVYLQEFVAGKWRTIVTTRTLASKAALRFKFTTRGTFYLRVVVASDTHANGVTSATDKFTVY